MKKMLSKTVATLAVLLATSVQAGRADLRTYRFIEDNVPLAFRYSGGLSGYQIQATLTGTFEVTIPENNIAYISKFDVNISEAIVSDPLGFGSPLGTPVSDYLHREPLKLPLELRSDIDTQINERMEPPQGNSIISTMLQREIPTETRTSIRLDFSSTNQAAVYIFSFQPNVLDGGSASTSYPGLPVVLIPEPQALVLCIMGLMGIPRRRSEMRRTD